MAFAWIHFSCKFSQTTRKNALNAQITPKKCPSSTFINLFQTLKPLSEKLWMDFGKPLIKTRQFNIYDTMKSNCFKP